jgi:hypothetical protein
VIPVTSETTPQPVNESLELSNNLAREFDDIETVGNIASQTNTSLELEPIDTNLKHHFLPTLVPTSQATTGTPKSARPSTEALEILDITSTSPLEQPEKRTTQNDLQSVISTDSAIAQDDLPITLSTTTEQSASTSNSALSSSQDIQNSEEEVGVQNGQEPEAGQAVSSDVSKTVDDFKTKGEPSVQAVEYDYVSHSVTALNITSDYDEYSFNEQQQQQFEQQEQDHPQQQQLQQQEEQQQLHEMEEEKLKNNSGKL